MTTTKQSELEKTIIKISQELLLITQENRIFMQAQNALNADHEKRLRAIEDLAAKIDSKIDREVGVIKERQTIGNILQGGFATIAAVIAAVFARTK